MVSSTLGSLPKVRRVHSSAISARGQVGIPRQASVAVEVGLREVVAQPVVVQAHVDHAHEAAGGPMKGAAGDQRLDGRGPRGGVHVEIERLFPHRNQEDRVARLPEVLLGDLQLDGLVGLFERAE